MFVVLLLSQKNRVGVDNTALLNSVKSLSPEDRLVLEKETIDYFKKNISGSEIVITSAPNKDELVPMGSDLNVFFGTSSIEFKND